MVAENPQQRRGKRADVVSGVADAAQVSRREGGERQPKGVSMKRFLIIITGLAIVVALAAGFSSSTGAAAATSPRTAKVLIKHQMRGCHAWSVNAGAFGVSRSARVATGGSVTFTDNDIMPHKLILTSGPAVRFVGNAAMSHMGASVKVVFPRAGTYRFTTRFGEDYKGITMKTVGEDNVIHLTVTVS
jgi:plastocyanin